MSTITIRLEKMSNGDWQATTKACGVLLCGYGQTIEGAEATLFVSIRHRQIPGLHEAFPELFTSTVVG